MDFGIGGIFKGTFQSIDQFFDDPSVMIVTAITLLIIGYMSAK